MAIQIFGTSRKPIGDGGVWTLRASIESELIPADEIEKRNSSKSEEHKKQISDEKLIKEFNTGSDSNA